MTQPNKTKQQHNNQCPNCAQTWHPQHKCTQTKPTKTPQTEQQKREQKKQEKRRRSPALTPLEKAAKSSLTNPALVAGLSFLEVGSVDESKPVVEVEGSVGEADNGFLTVDAPGASKQVLLRVSEDMKTRWVLASEREGKNLSEFIRDAVDSHVSDLLDCSHPSEMRRTYRWSDVCLACGTRLR